MKQFKKLKIGIVGCGYWATNFINTLENLDILNITIFDKDTSKIYILKKKFNFLKSKNNLNSFLDGNYDCVFLITPPSTHYELAKKIIEKKFNIFIEKPTTLKSSDLKKLIKLSKFKKIIMMTGYIYNYNVYINYIKKVLQKKELGKIKYIYFERSNLGPIRNDTSCIWDLASHDISTSIFLLNSFPKILNVNTHNFLKKKLYDISNINLDFSGVKVEIKSSWINPEKIRKLVIVGESKMLQFDEMQNKNKIKIYNKYATYPNLKIFKKNFFTPSAFIYLGKTTIPRIKYQSPMIAELYHFFSCIKNKKEPITSGNHALEVMKVIEKIEKKLTKII